MEIITGIMRKAKRAFFLDLVKSNTGVSSKNFFLVCTTIIGLVMLIVLVAGFIVDMIFNHTITVDMGSAAAYIGAVASLFAAAGLTKAGSEWSENKYIYNTHKEHSQKCEGDEEEVPIPDEEECTD